MPSQALSHDKELAEFFTDVEYLRDAFKEMVTRDGCISHRGQLVPLWAKQTKDA